MLEWEDAAFSQMLLLSTNCSTVTGISTRIKPCICPIPNPERYFLSSTSQATSMFSICSKDIKGNKYGASTNRRAEWIRKRKSMSKCVGGLWCWSGLMRIPWTAKRSNHSILKKFNPEYSLEGLMPNLHYFGHLMQRADSLGKSLMLVKIEGRRRRGWLDGITDSMDMSLSKLRDSEGQGGLVCCRS